MDTYGLKMDRYGIRTAQLDNLLNNLSFRRNIKSWHLLSYFKTKLQNLSQLKTDTLDLSKYKITLKSKNNSLFRKVLTVLTRGRIK